MKSVIAEDWYDCPLELVDIVLEYTNDTIYISEEGENCFGFTVGKGTYPNERKHRYGSNYVGTISTNDLMVLNNRGAELIWTEGDGAVNHICYCDSKEIAIMVLKKLKFIYEHELGNQPLIDNVNSETVINQFIENNGIIFGLVYSDDIFVERLV